MKFSENIFSSVLDNHSHKQRSNTGTIGIIGGSHLARMLILAGKPLGLDFILLDPDETACAGQLCQHIIAPFDDTEALKKLNNSVDLITVDHDSVSQEVLDYLQNLEGCIIYPPIPALKFSQDRVTEKKLFQSLNIPTPAFVTVNSLEDLFNGLEKVGLPCILKTRKMGCDGRAQIIIHDSSECEKAFLSLGSENLILEQFISFIDEVSMIAIRNQKAETVYYPLIKNIHENGILKSSFAPFGDNGLINEAKIYVNSILNHLDYTGTLTIEFFIQDGKLVANEIAPRVHNSGHLTIEASMTSQFENHLRAILNWPLGQTGIQKPVAMINFLDVLPDVIPYLNTQNCHLHYYQEKNSRKIGHATLIGEDQNQLATIFSTLTNHP